MKRDALSAYSGYSAVLARPRADEPRLALSDEIAAQFPVRAKNIQNRVEIARLEAAAIVDRRGAPDRVGQLSREVRRKPEESWEQWVVGEGLLDLISVRGFLECLVLNVGELAEEHLGAWERFPLLHLRMSFAANDSLPVELIEHMPALSSIWIDDIDDQQFIALVERGALDNLRRLGLRAPLTEQSLHALCARDLPDLEELIWQSPNATSPCEVASWVEWTGETMEVTRSAIGDKLEEKYGFKKYFHAISRFSIHPYDLGVLDILPRLPDDMQLMPRRDPR